MLKRYVTGGRIQWTGKAWEIRRAIREQLRLSGGDVRVAELLAGQDDAGPRPIPHHNGRGDR